MTREKAEHRNTTLGDIAERAGVSKTAVSKVLNGRPIRIGAERREEILALAESLNYRPNMIARGLRGRTTRTVGIVIPDLTTLFYPELVRRIETSLTTEGYQTTICNSADDPLRERRQLEDLLARLVDALILVPATGDTNLAFLREIEARRVPFIVLDRYYPEEPFHYVTTDNRGGAAAGTKWLLEQGVSRVLYLGDERRNQALEDRVSGVREATTGASVPFSRNDLFLCAPDRSVVSQTCCALFENAGSDAGIFLESHRMMPGLLDACRERGIRLPNDFATVGFDAFEPSLLTEDDLASLHVLTAPPATLLQDTLGMADGVCRFLLARFAEAEPPDAHWQTLLPPRLITKGEGKA